MQCYKVWKYFTVNGLLKIVNKNMYLSFSVVTKEPITVINKINFLGMRLSVKEAETGFNTAFALLIVMTAAICLSVGFFLFKRHSKKSKKTENIELDGKL